MVAGLVPMVPEGLVLLTSVAFAVGVVRLGRQRCLVQELPAIEGLARVDVVCLDKTGTLTEPDMQVSEVHLLDPAAPRRRGARRARRRRRTAQPEPAGDRSTPIRRRRTGRVLSRTPFSSDRKWGGATFTDPSGDDRRMAARRARRTAAGRASGAHPGRRVRRPGAAGAAAGPPRPGGDPESPWW